MLAVIMAALGMSMVMPAIAADSFFYASVAGLGAHEKLSLIKVKIFDLSGQTWLRQSQSDLSDNVWGGVVAVGSGCGKAAFIIYQDPAVPTLARGYGGMTTVWYPSLTPPNRFAEGENKSCHSGAPKGRTRNDKIMQGRASHDAGRFPLRAMRFGGQDVGQDSRPQQIIAKSIIGDLKG